MSAVAGTLAGGLVPVWLQGRRARDSRREERSAARQTAVLSAVTGLFAALADHRRAMWALEGRRLSNAAEHLVVEATAATHETRAGGAPCPLWFSRSCLTPRVHTVTL